MPRKSTGKQPKRPLLPIDWKKVEVMMLAGAPGTEIAGSLGVHPDTFYNRYYREYGVGFSDAMYSKKQGGYANIRARQYIAAMNGNTQMLKILGEEWLGQGRGNADNSAYEREEILLEQEKAVETSVHIGSDGKPGIPTEQPLSHQKCTGKENEILHELGATDTMEGET